MVKDTKWLRAWALAALAVAVVRVAGDPLASAAVADLMGSGPGLAALLWGCGVCVGGAALLLTGPAGALIEFLAVGANLARITACVGACYGAFTA